MRRRLLAWALDYREGAETLVNYYRGVGAEARVQERLALSVSDHGRAANCAQVALVYERCLEANRRRLNFWDCIACWFGAASIVPGRGLNF